MKFIDTEPDFEEFDGVYFGSKNISENIPPNSFNLEKVKKLLNKGKKFSNFSEEDFL